MLVVGGPRVVGREATVRASHAISPSSRRSCTASTSTSGGPCSGWSLSSWGITDYFAVGERLEAYRTDETRARQWIAEAAAELAAGRPAFALTVGRELHWLDADPYRGDALDLLAGAYRALGRDALAGIAEVHAAHRDLPSVAVLQQTPSAELLAAPWCGLAGWPDGAQLRR